MPTAERARFDGIRVPVVDGRVFARALPVSGRAPMVVVGVAPALGRVHPIPAARALVRADMAARVPAIFRNALHNPSQVGWFGHVEYTVSL